MQSIVSFPEKLLTEDFASIPNLNWLIHIAYARHDFKYCKDVIDYQFRVTYDHEYLYLVKVKPKISKIVQYY